MVPIHTLCRKFSFLALRKGKVLRESSVNPSRRAKRAGENLGCLALRKGRILRESLVKTKPAREVRRRKFGFLALRKGGIHRKSSEIQAGARSAPATIWSLVLAQRPNSPEIDPARKARREMRFDLAAKTESLRKSTRRAKRAGGKCHFDLAAKALSPGSVNQLIN